MLIEAIELLVGGRADATIVRTGAAEARVDGRILVDGADELVLSRVIPADGRSRAYVNGRPATVATLAELTDGVIDLHGQHAHQSLLSGVAQRAALDAFGAIDLAPLRAARARVTEIDAELAALGRRREGACQRDRPAAIPGRRTRRGRHRRRRRGRAVGERGDAAGRRGRPPRGGADRDRGAPRRRRGGRGARHRAPRPRPSPAVRAAHRPPGGRVGRARRRRHRPARPRRGDRGGPGTAGGDSRTPAAAEGSAPQVRRRPGRGDGVPRRGRAPAGRARALRAARRRTRRGARRARWPTSAPRGGDRRTAPA